MSDPGDQRVPVFIAVGFSALGLGLSLYLSWLSLAGASAAGCGAGTGCSEVLASKWSKVGSIPVAFFGVLAYLSLLIGFLLYARSQGKSLFAQRLLALLAPPLVVAMLWFTYLQRYKIGVLCPFCMITHGIGFICFWLIVFFHFNNGVKIKVIVPLLAGAALGLCIIPVQVYLTPEPAVQRAPNLFADQDGDAWIDDARHVSMFGGQLQFVLQDVPYIGDPQADQVVAVLFDYACPFCKTLHDMLGEAIEQDPSRFVLVPIPLSIHESVNAFISSDHPRFEDSLDLARLSLAVAEMDPQAWQAFDRWLFAGDEPGDFPRSFADARQHAESMVEPTRLGELLDDPLITPLHEQVAEHISLLGQLPEEKRYIPVTTTPGAAEHLTTRFDDVGVLYEMLDLASPVRP